MTNVEKENASTLKQFSQENNYKKNVIDRTLKSTSKISIQLKTTFMEYLVNLPSMVCNIEVKNSYSQSSFHKYNY